MTMVVIIFGIICYGRNDARCIFNFEFNFGAIINKTIRVPLNIDGILLEVISI